MVDPQLRARGIEGPRAVAASVTPRVASANTLAATLMVGEKAAGLIGRVQAPPAERAIDAVALQEA